MPICKSHVLHLLNYIHEYNILAVLSITHIFVFAWMAMQTGYWLLKTTKCFAISSSSSSSSSSLNSNFWWLHHTFGHKSLQVNCIVVDLTSKIAGVYCVSDMIPLPFPPGSSTPTPSASPPSHKIPPSYTPLPITQTWERTHCVIMPLDVSNKPAETAEYSTEKNRRNISLYV